MCDSDRVREGTELFEYCESLFLEACEVGCCRFNRLEGGDVIKGGNGG
jgi:hypothetical protein